AKATHVERRELELLMSRRICLGVLQVLLFECRAAVASKSACQELYSCVMSGSAPAQALGVRRRLEFLRAQYCSLEATCGALAARHRRLSTGRTGIDRAGRLVKHEIPLVERRRSPRQTRNTRQEARCASATVARIHSGGLWRHRVSSHWADLPD